MKIRILLLAIASLLSSQVAASAKGSAVLHDDPWNPDHIADLPSEVRHYIARLCKGPASARHDFATYSPREKRWRVNMEYLRCEGLSEYRHGHKCLDVDFIEVGTHYRLGTKAYRDCGY